MSTSTKIVITPENTGLWNIQQSEEAAQAASELLQKDLEVKTCGYGPGQSDVVLIRI